MSNETTADLSVSDEFTLSVGATLQRERELRKISLEEVAQSTRIPLRTLRHIEEDAWSELPGEIFAKGFLRSYATWIGLDPRPLVARLERYRVADVLDEETNLMAPGADGAPERGRRVGVALAVIVLLILFTLALSIVVRPPRRRDVPVELSQSVPALVSTTHA